jgi:hypothetical protein
LEKIRQQLLMDDFMGEPSFSSPSPPPPSIGKLKDIDFETALL